MKKISVIMSVYNSENFLKKSIESILNQTYENFQFLIINDCSTDKSLSILEYFKKKDKRVYIFENKSNIGLTKSLNKLLENAEGDLIARHDADDISDKSRFENQINFLNQHGYDGCTTKASSLQTGETIHKVKNYIPPKILIKYKNPFIHGSLMIYKKVIDSIGGYNEDYKYAQDYKLMTDLLNNGYKIKIMKKNLYRLNTIDNISTIYKFEQQYFANCVRKNIDPKNEN